MQSLEEVEKQAIEFYSLAFLLTGQSETSTNVAVAALDLTGASLTASRRAVMTNALSSIRTELQDSSRRLETELAIPVPFRAATGDLVHDLTKAEVRRALLAMDTLPRCAVVLRVLEGVTLEDASALLNAGEDLVCQAQACRTTGPRPFPARTAGGHRFSRAITPHNPRRSLTQIEDGGLRNAQQ